MQEAPSRGLFCIRMPKNAGPDSTKHLKVTPIAANMRRD